MPDNGIEQERYEDVGRPKNGSTTTNLTVWKLSIQVSPPFPWCYGSVQYSVELAAHECIDICCNQTEPAERKYNTGLCWFVLIICTSKLGDSGLSIKRDNTTGCSMIMLYEDLWWPRGEMNIMHIKHTSPINSRDNQNLAVLCTYRAISAEMSHNTEIHFY